MTTDPNEIERLSQSAAKARDAYMQLRERNNAGEKIAPVAMHDARHEFYDADDAYGQYLLDHADSLSEAIRERDRLATALIRLGTAVIEAGPPDDNGPDPEIEAEYYAARDAVQLLAVELATAALTPEQP